MSDIALSASVRRTCCRCSRPRSFLATTQIRLSTGKKVNTALDDPTNFFTAQGLDSRQRHQQPARRHEQRRAVLQLPTPASPRCRSCSIPRIDRTQVLQAPVGYSVKASATSLAPTGAGALVLSELPQI